MTPCPAISVLMPVLNPHPVYFPEAVASILEQTFTDWELVIVEDPSPSSAAELLKEFSDPRIRLVTNAHRSGLVRQLNQGLDLCRAKWVARFDADDICLPTRLSEQFAFLRENPTVGVLGSRLEVMSSDGQPLGIRAYPLAHADILRAMTRFNPVGHPAVIYLKSIVTDAGGYRETRHAGVEDYDLWCRLAKAGVIFATHPLALVRYRLHSQAMKVAKLRETIRGSIQVKRDYWTGSFGLRGRARLVAERLMLCLPASVVMWCFRSTQLAKRRPSAGREAAVTLREQG